MDPVLCHVAIPLERRNHLLENKCAPKSAINRRAVEHHCILNVVARVAHYRYRRVLARGEAVEIDELQCGTCQSEALGRICVSDVELVLYLRSDT